MKKITNQFFNANTPRILFGCVLAFALTACSTIQNTSNAIKSIVVSPAPDTAFIPDSKRQINQANLPFQKAWFNPSFKFSDYDYLVVAPVTTDFMLEMDWFKELNTVNVLSDVARDYKNLAVYFKNQVVASFKNDPEQLFLVLDYPTRQTKSVLQLELALIEIDPSIPELNAAAWLVPWGGVAMTVINPRMAAYEARLRDLSTHEIVATFADRDMQDFDPLDLTDLTWWGPAKQIMDQWAKEFVQVANRKPGETVNHPTAFSLKPF